MNGDEVNEPIDGDEDARVAEITRVGKTLDDRMIAVMRYPFEKYAPTSLDPLNAFKIHMQRRVAGYRTVNDLQDDVVRFVTAMKSNKVASGIGTIEKGKPKHPFTLDRLIIRGTRETLFFGKGDYFGIQKIEDFVTIIIPFLNGLMDQMPDGIKMGVWIRKNGTSYPFFYSYKYQYYNKVIDIIGRYLGHIMIRNVAWFHPLFIGEFKINDNYSVTAVPIVENLPGSNQENLSAARRIYFKSNPYPTVAEIEIMTALITGTGNESEIIVLNPPSDDETPPPQFTDEELPMEEKQTVFHTEEIEVQVNKDIAETVIEQLLLGDAWVQELFADIEDSVLEEMLFEILRAKPEERTELEVYPRYRDVVDTGRFVERNRDLLRIRDANPGAFQYIRNPEPFQYMHNPEVFQYMHSAGADQADTVLTFDRTQPTLSILSAAQRRVNAEIQAKAIFVEGSGVGIFPSTNMPPSRYTGRPYGRPNRVPNPPRTPNPPRDDDPPRRRIEQYVDPEIEVEDEFDPDQFYHQTEYQTTRADMIDLIMQIIDIDMVTIATFSDKLITFAIEAIASGTVMTLAAATNLVETMLTGPNGLLINDNTIVRLSTFLVGSLLAGKGAYFLYYYVTSDEGAEDGEQFNIKSTPIKNDGTIEPGILSRMPWEYRLEENGSITYYLGSMPDAPDPGGNDDDDGDVDGNSDDFPDEVYDPEKRGDEKISKEDAERLARSSEFFDKIVEESEKLSSINESILSSTPQAVVSQFTIESMLDKGKVIELFKSFISMGFTVTQAIIKTTAHVFVALPIEWRIGTSIVALLGVTSILSNSGLVTSSMVRKIFELAGPAGRIAFVVLDGTWYLAKKAAALIENVSATYGSGAAVAMLAGGAAIVFYLVSTLRVVK